MRAVVSRIAKLEDQLGTGDGKAQILLVVCRAGWEGALDQDACIQILGETGFLPTGRIGVVNLLEVPEGMDAEQTKVFLRENAEDLCGLHGVREQQSEASLGNRRDENNIQAPLPA